MQAWMQARYGLRLPGAWGRRRGGNLALSDTLLQPNALLVGDTAVLISPEHQHKKVICLEEHAQDPPERRFFRYGQAQGAAGAADDTEKQSRIDNMAATSKSRIAGGALFVVLVQGCRRSLIFCTKDVYIHNRYEQGSLQSFWCII